MAEARANPLLGGYDEEFVNEVEDELHCAICQLPLNEPMLTKIEHSETLFPAFLESENQFPRQGLVHPNSL